MCLQERNLVHVSVSHTHKQMPRVLHSQTVFCNPTLQPRMCSPLPWVTLADVPLCSLTLHQWLPMVPCSFQRSKIVAWHFKNGSSIGKASKPTCSLRTQGFLPDVKVLREDKDKSWLPCPHSPKFCWTVIAIHVSAWEGWGSEKPEPAKS